MPEHFNHQLLATLVLSHLPASPESLRFSPVKTGKHNSSFWVESNLGQFVLRIAPPDDAGFLFYERLMMRQEPELHALIRAKTNIPVASVAGYDFSRTQIERDYVLLEALPGTPLSDTPGLTAARFNQILKQTGQYLRQLHQITATDIFGAPQFGYLGAHQPMMSQPDWGTAFKVMWHKLIDDVAACGSYTPDEAGAMRGLLELHHHHFERPVTPRLLHMDIWGQNILANGEGTVTGLVDFDRALWGDVEIEFAVLDYCGISRPAFWEGYGRPRDESPAAMIRRQFYLLYELQKYMPIRVWRRKDPAGALEYKRQALSLAAQLLPPH